MEIENTDYCFSGKNQSIHDMIYLINHYMMKTKDKRVGEESTVSKILTDYPHSIINLRNKCLPDLLGYQCTLLMDTDDNYPYMITLNNVDTIQHIQYMQQGKSYFVRMLIQKDSPCWVYDHKKVKACAVIEYILDGQIYYIATIVGLLLKKENEYPCPTKNDFNFDIDIMDYINPQSIDEGLQYDYIQDETIQLIYERASKLPDYKEVQRYDHSIKGTITEVINKLIEDGYCFKWINNEHFTDFTRKDDLLDIFESDIAYYSLSNDKKPPNNSIHLFGLGLCGNMPFQIDSKNNIIKTFGVASFDDGYINCPQYATPIELQILKRPLFTIPTQDEFNFDDDYILKERPSCNVEYAQLDYVGKEMLDLLKERSIHKPTYLQNISHHGEISNLSKVLGYYSKLGYRFQWINHEKFENCHEKDVSLSIYESSEFMDVISLWTDENTSFLDFMGVELLVDMPFKIDLKSKTIKTFGLVYFENSVNEIRYATPIDLKVLDLPDKKG